MRILVADDDAVSLRLLESFIARLGHEPVTARDGQEAWTKYRELELSFAILDWMMPVFDGIEVCRMIRDLEKAQLGKYCYVMFLTARNQTQDLVLGLETGADDFITKPFDQRELHARIEAGIRILALRDQLVQANQAKTELVNMVVHDFGNPLTAIRGQLEFLRDGPRDPLAAARILERVLAGVTSLEKLRRDMLELARFETGDILLERSVVNIADLVRQCVAELKPLADGKGQTIENTVPETRVNCDPRRIRQAITNYVANAIRYTGENGSIQVRADRKDGFMHLTVADNGRGIAREEQEQVFRPLSRSGGDMTGTASVPDRVPRLIRDRVPGQENITGFGLAIVRKIVTAHEGRAWCESEPGQGSIFHFMIPVVYPPLHRPLVPDPL